MRILAIDTTTPYLLLAYGEGGSIDVVREEVGRAHSVALLPSVVALLAGRRPEAVAVAAGPGSYTGIRIGMATAEGLARGFGIPKVALPTFVGWTYGRARPGETVLAASDARGGRVFAQAWRDGEEVLPLDLYEGKALASLAANSLVVSLTEDLLPARRHEAPDAIGLLKAAEACLARGEIPLFAPVYVRPAKVDQRR